MLFIAACYFEKDHASFILYKMIIIIIIIIVIIIISNIYKKACTEVQLIPKIAHSSMLL